MDHVVVAKDALLRELSALEHAYDAGAEVGNNRHKRKCLAAYQALKAFRKRIECGEFDEENDVSAGVPKSGEVYPRRYAH